MDRVRLVDVEGIDLYTGHDEEGRTWSEFELDVADPPYICSICGDEIHLGWLCANTGDTICDAHVDEC